MTSEGESFSPLRRPVGEAELPLRGNQAGLHPLSFLSCLGGKGELIFLAQSVRLH